jgi:pilus assembly protein CpaB
VGLVAALVLATIGTFTIVAYVRGANSRALDGQKTVDVYVVQSSIAAGTPVDKLGDHVRRLAIVKQVEANGAITDLAQLKGRVAGAELVPGEQLVQARFVDASAYRAAAEGVSIPDGMLETTVVLDPERALGGLITAGMHVGVTASFDDKNNATAETHMILNSVLVTNVQLTPQGSGSSSFGSSSGAGASAASNDKPGMAAGGRVYVTLALSAPDAERVIFAAERGSLWLSNEPGNANSSGTKIVTRSNALQ